MAVWNAVGRYSPPRRRYAKPLQVVLLLLVQQRVHLGDEAAEPLVSRLRLADPIEGDGRAGHHAGALPDTDDGGDRLGDCRHQHVEDLRHVGGRAAGADAEDGLEPRLVRDEAKVAFAGREARRGEVDVEAEEALDDQRAGARAERQLADQRVLAECVAEGDARLHVRRHHHQALRRGEAALPAQPVLERRHVDPLQDDVGQVQDLARGRANLHPARRLAEDRRHPLPDDLQHPLAGRVEQHRGLAAEGQRDVVLEVAECRAHRLRVGRRRLSLDGEAVAKRVRQCARGRPRRQRW
mmetsp:Transcript_34219/g.107383  ORF Transcript_34219/g.107383 Transcript_34219/m.107383 type:complete len:296 (+) Transcript_34219:158-1045(+)